jgi:uncharacterized protein (TIGR03435 family)
VQQGETSTKLLPGEQVKSNPLMESQSVRKEIAWSRSAEAHLVLLQQSALQVPAEPRLTFVEASVKPSSPPTGGTGRGAGLQRACGGDSPQIDPARFAVTNWTLYRLITVAYGRDCIAMEASEFSLLSGGPGWSRSDEFEIQALIPGGSPSYTTQQFMRGEAPKLQAMLQTLLADRFKLTLNREVKELPVYLLTSGRGKPKLSSAKDGDRVKEALVIPGGQTSVHLIGGKLSIAKLADQLTIATGRLVLDRTGIPGEFNYDVAYVPIDNQTNADIARERGWSGRSLSTALQEDLGLQLNSSKEKVEILAIDHAERPSPN